MTVISTMSNHIKSNCFDLIFFFFVIHFLLYFNIYT